MNGALRILMVEDSADDAQLVADTLISAGYTLTWERVETAVAMRDALARGPWDAALCDYSMPRFDVSGALAELRASGHELPFIIVSGVVGEDAAVEAMRAGVHDYVMKNRLTRLPAVVARELGAAAERRARRALEENLSREQQRFTALVEKSAEAIAILDRDGGVVYASPSTQNVLGFTAVDVVGHSMFEFIHPDDVPAVRAVLAEVVATARALHPEARFVRKDGEVRWLSGCVANLLAEPSVGGIVVNYHDTTDRKRTECALRESEEKFRLTTSTARDAIIMLDAQARVVFWNDAATTILGYSREETIGRELHGFLVPERYRDAAQKGCAAFRHTGQGAAVARTLELSALRKDGVEVPVELSISSAQLQGQWHAFGILRDITARKEAEGKVRRSEERFRNLTENTSDWIWEVNEQGSYTYASPRIRELLGYEPGELLGRTPFMLMPVDEALRMKKLFADLVAKRLPLVAVENINLHKDGHQVVVETSAVPVFDSDGSWRGYRGIDRDITERKEAGKKLQMFRALIDHSTDAIQVIDTQTARFLDFSDSASAQLDYTRKELLALTVMDVNPDIDLARFDAMIFALRQSRFTTFETRLRRKAGTVLPVEVSLSLVGLDREYGVAIVRDITARKQHEEQLRLLSTALLAAPNCIVITDKSGSIEWVNPAFTRVTGYTAGEAIGRNPRILKSGWQSPEFYAELWRTITSGQSWHGEFVNKRKDGSLYTEEATIAPVRDANGDIQHFVAIKHDVTARKEAEAALRGERDMFDSLAGTVPDLIYFKDRQSRFVRINPAMMRLFGLQSAADALGKTDFDFFTEEHARQAYDDEQRLMRTGEPIVAVEEKETWPDGHVTWASTTKIPWRDDGGDIIGIFGISRDITIRKEGEWRIRAQAELIDKANEAIVASDLDNRITFWSHGAERMMGWTTNEMIGRTVGEILALDAVTNTSGVASALTTATDWRGEIDGRTREDKALRLEVSITLLRDAAGRPSGRLAVCTDITQKKELEARYLRAQRLESLGMLAAGISHDLNNILAPIGMVVPLLQTKITAPSDHRLLATLEKCAERGAGLVKQILGFAHGAGTEPRLVQVKHLLRDVSSVITETFPKSIVFDEEVSRDLRPVLANPTQIHQVLLNLCVNARDAMPDGGKLRLLAENVSLDNAAAAALEAVHPGAGVRPGVWIVLHVEDSGTGIAPEVLDHIWEPFFTTKGPDKGTGLGLATVRGIVEAHHGFVTVQTKPGLGTAFRVYLPAAEDAASVAPFAATAKAGREGRGEHILIVDDEESIRDTAAAILSEAGYRVTTAADGAVAANLFGAGKTEFALVVTDLDMPRLDGASLARVVRAAKPTMKILAMSGITARANEKDPAEFADAFLSKPFGDEPLLRTIRQLLTS